MIAVYGLMRQVEQEYGVHFAACEVKLANNT